MAGEKLENLKSIKKSIPVSKGWRLNQIKKINQGNIIGHVLVLENKTKSNRNIEVAHLWKDSVLAITVEKHAIKAGGNTHVYIVTNENGLSNKAHKSEGIIKEGAFDWYLNREDK